MNQRVLIFRPLKEKLQNAVDYLKERDAETVFFTDWTDLARHLHEPACCAIILPVASEGLDGIRCCQQIKARKAFKSVRVFILSAGDVGSAEKEAKAAGCDMFASGDDVDAVNEALNEALWTDMSAARRAALRFELSGKFLVIRNETAVVAEILNLSRTGILFASKDEVPLETEVTLRIQSSQGSEMDVHAVVRRALILPPHFGDFRHGIGAEFSKLDAAGMQTIDWLLAYRERRLPSWSLKAVEKILSADAPRLATMLREETSRAFLDVFVKDLPLVERQALESDSYSSEVIRDLVVSRVHCTAFFMFVPEAKRSRAFLTGAFADSFEKLLKRVAKAEVQAEKRIQECFSRSMMDEHLDLVGASDRLQAVKLKLLFAVDELLASDGVPDARGDFFRKVREQVEAIRLRQQKAQETD